MNEVQQQLLNESVAHIRKQGKPSAFPSYNAIGEKQAQCRYRDDSGKLMCAAGIFIRQYNRYMETKVWGGITGPDAVVDYSANLDPRAVQERVFVEHVLQHSHDQAAHEALEGVDFLTSYERHLKDAVENWNSLSRIPPTTPLVIPA